MPDGSSASIETVEKLETHIRRLEHKPSIKKMNL